MRKTRTEIIYLIYKVYYLIYTQLSMDASIILANDVLNPECLSSRKILSFLSAALLTPQTSKQVQINIHKITQLVTHQLVSLMFIFT